MRSNTYKRMRDLGKIGEHYFSQIYENNGRAWPMGRGCGRNYIAGHGFGDISTPNFSNSLSKYNYIVELNSGSESGNGQGGGKWINREILRKKGI